MRYVLGSRASIGGPLGSGRGGAAAWYLAGGVSAANCVAAYQPIGAASLAASYVNLANPGTYTAAPGAAPTFAAATGWTFAAASSQYLTTGVVPAAGWSMIVRFSGVTDAGIVAGSDSSPTGSRFWILPANATTVAYGYGVNVRSVPPSLTSGVLGIAAFDCYRNGVSDGTITAATILTFPSIYVGARNLAGSASNFIAGKIQAVAIYNATLSAAQVAAISSAMASL